MNIFWKFFIKVSCQDFSACFYGNKNLAPLKEIKIMTTKVRLGSTHTKRCQNKANRGHWLWTLLFLYTLSKERRVYAHRSFGRVYKKKEGFMRDRHIPYVTIVSLQYLSTRVSQLVSSRSNAWMLLLQFPIVGFEHPADGVLSLTSCVCVRQILSCSNHPSILDIEWQHARGYHG